MLDLLTPIGVAFALIAWSVFQGRLARAAQPLRLRLAEKGERLLARTDLSPETRKDVEFMLNTPFSRWGMLLFVVATAPFVVLYVAFTPKARAHVERDFSKMSPEARALYADVRALHTRIVMANHPLLASIVLLEITALLAPVSLVMLALQNEGSEAPLDRYAFINIVEMQEQTLMSKFRRRPLAARCTA